MVLLVSVVVVLTWLGEAGEVVTVLKFVVVDAELGKTSLPLMTV